MKGLDIFMTNWIRDYVVGNEMTMTCPYKKSLMSKYTQGNDKTLKKKSFTD